MPEIVGDALYGGDFRVGSQASLPFVLPGEALERGAGEVRILKSSPERVAARCVHFGACGGCQYQHASYPAQLAIKRDLLSSMLAQVCTSHVPEVVIHAAEPWGYRNRVRLRFQWSAAGCAIGYSRRGSNSFLPIQMCPIAAPLLLRAAETIRTLGARGNDAGRWLAATREVELFCTPTEDRLQVHFLLGECSPRLLTPAGFADLCSRLQVELPELTGAGASVHPDEPRRARQRWPGASYGRIGLLYPAAGREYWVSRGAFFQVNRFLIDTLVDLVTGGREGRLAWDLYAGVGLFSRSLAETYEQVQAVEGSPAAFADLSALNRARPGIAARGQSTLSFLQEAETQRDRPDLVVLDPPRAGLGEVGAAMLARIAPSEIVYVSCDPTSLVRDLALLLRAGYVIESVDLLDLFPQTYHLETVLVLRRAGP